MLISTDSVYEGTALLSSSYAFLFRVSVSHVPHGSIHTINPNSLSFSLSVCVKPPFAWSSGITEGLLWPSYALSFSLSSLSLPPFPPVCLCSVSMYVFVCARGRKRACVCMRVGVGEGEWVFAPGYVRRIRLGAASAGQDA